jgi:hypothetical protein
MPHSGPKTLCGFESDFCAGWAAVFTTPMFTVPPHLGRPANYAVRVYSRAKTATDTVVYRQT